MCVLRTEQKDLEIWIWRNNTLRYTKYFGVKKLQVTLSSLPVSKADNGVVSLPLRRQSRHGSNVRLNVISYLGRLYKLATYFARKCSLQHIMSGIVVVRLYKVSTFCFVPLSAK